MADRLSDDQVAALLAILRKDASIDAKVQQVTAAKSAIKQHNVPDSCVAPLFDALRLASSSPHSALVNAGFTALNHLLTRLSRQDPKLILRDAKHTLPLVVDKMGDPKDKFRALALQAMVTFYHVAPTDAERFVRNQALVGKNPRAKEAGMQWLLQMHRDHGLQFRAYVPTLMELLEDADGIVRDTARATVIDLFRDAPNAAKSDLKRQLKNFKVRPAIEQAIVKELAPVGGALKRDPDSRPGSAMSAARPNLSASVSSASAAADRPNTPLPEAKTDPVDPAYVNTQRELDGIFKDMHEWFEGKETEQNWLKREQSIVKLRKLIAGNAPDDFSDPFVAGCRALLDGIIKAVVSLRTSLSKEGSSLVLDLANAFGPAIDPLVELLMQTFIKLCASTKKIASQLANTVVDTLISRCTYTNRIMQHVWGACQDKNVQPRTYVTGWVKTIVKKEAHHKNQIENSGGLDLFEKCIKKGLADANPGVREKMRPTYWEFAAVWPQRAEIIMENLDSTAQKLLQKDPSNPNSPKKADGAPAVRAGLGLSRSTTASKPSLREAMMAQKKAMSSKNLPARPGSAMAEIAPHRTVSGTSSASAAAKPAAAARPRPETSNLAHGGMSHAPMRPVRRRPAPEVAARPATAGPYSMRSHDGPSAERSSPAEPRTKTYSSKTISGSPKRTVPRTRPGHASALSESHVTTPTRAAASRAAAASPRPSPPKATSTPKNASPPKTRALPPHPIASSPSKPSDELALDAPSIEALKQSLNPPPIDAAAESAPEESLESTQEAEAEAAPSPAPEAVTETTPEVAPEEAPEVAPEGAPEEALGEAPEAASEAAPEGETEAIPEVQIETVPAVEAKVAIPPPESLPSTPSKPLQVYEDPFNSDQDVTPRAPTATETPQRPVLEDKPVNEDAAHVGRQPLDTNRPELSPEKARQNSRLLDSGITRVKAKTLDVHGFRKVQSLIRDGKSLFTDDKFDTLLLGLFEYLESPLESLAPEKVQDVRAQVLTTIKLLLKKNRDSFQPHISRGLESLIATRACYDARNHIVSGLELLADELVAIGDADEITVTMTRNLSSMDAAVGRPSAESFSSSTASMPPGGPTAPSALSGSRSLSMGLHVLKELIDGRTSFVPNDSEVAALAALTGRCLESRESGVRMDAVQLCVAMHARLGDAAFWNAMRGQGVRDDPKSLITYYVVKRQRETAATGAAPAVAA